MLEGFIPSRKNVLLVVLIGCAFFVGTQFVFAQPTGFDTTEDFETSTGGTPGFPEFNPVVFPPPQPPSNPSSPSTGTNNPPGGVDQIAADAAAAAQPSAEPAIQVSSSGCWNSPEGFLNCIVISFFGSIAAIAGYTFDAAISMFIVRFGELYLTAGIGSTVERVWTTVRDVFNLTFIFGLVYIGFQIILGTNESSAKRTLPLLILAALLVNFSLFVVKFIIDFANLAAIQIFNLFTANNQVGDQGTPTNGIVDVLANADGSSLSLAFLNTIGISGLLNNSIALDGAGGGVMYMFTMVIIFSVITYVFFAGAILITIRFAVLIFYMIFSPIMFLGWVFPGFKSYSDKFWQGLFGQAFFAPALLFMLYVTYQLAQGFNDGTRMGGEGIQADPENITAFAQFMPYLVMIVIFIVASLVVARKMANTGGSMVMKANDWALGKARVLTGAATAGVAARVGRNTLGAGAYALQNSDGFKDFAARRGRLGKMMTSGVGKVADGSFDARRVGGMGKKLDIGEGRKGGFATIIKEEKASDEKFLKELGTRKFEDTADAIRLQTGITALAANIDGVTDVNQKAHMKEQLAGLQAEFEARKKQFGSKEEYARQLSYIDKIERWKNFNKAQRFAGAGAGILASGVVLASGGLLAAPVMAAASVGYGYNSKGSAAALRKAYGKDGSTKKKSDAEEKAKKKALELLGYEEKKDDHGKKEEGGSKGGGGHSPAPAAAKASAAPAANHAGSGAHH
jgi:hypothetical protein